MGCVRRFRSVSGFTLIELIAIISIFGILGSLLLPALQKSIQRTRRAKDLNALKHLVVAYREYAMAKGRNVSIEDIEYWCGPGTHLMQGLAAVFAEADIIKDASIYVSANDFRYKNARSGTGGYAKKMFPPKVVLNKQGTFSNQFYQLGANDAMTFPIAFEGFIGSSDNAPPATTPIFFTRGAGEGGWDDTNPYGKFQGGYVAFLDGHVVWYDHFGADPEHGKFVKYGTSERTNNIAEAVPSDAVWLEARGVGKALK